MFKSRKLHTRWLMAFAIVFALVVVATNSQAADKGRTAFGSDRTGRWQIYTMNPDGSD